MSYVRWSSDNFRSDVYCYEDVSGGYTTHVAERRHSPEWHRLKKLRGLDDEKVLFPDDSMMENIGLSQDGKTFNDETEAVMLVRLLWLKKIGYRVPNDVLGNLERLVLNLE